jgi:hypothetical protein
MITFSSDSNAAAFLRSLAFGFGFFSLFLGVAGLIYGVEYKVQIICAIVGGLLALLLRFTVLRRRPPPGAH